ncbi:MAG: flavin-containing monooxygenase, partial [Gammaproteobacteria bacterium]
PIAERADILNYLQEVIADNQLQEKILYQHKGLSASWDSKLQNWLVQCQHQETGEQKVFRCNFLWMCQGYYDHAKGYTPDFAGMDDFQGSIVHPQTWPDDLDYTDKKIIVIGSGATAATLIPNLSEKAQHVTMLQRSPTYFFTGENRNELADRLRDLDIPPEWLHEILRRDILKLQQEVQTLSAQHPEMVKQELLSVIRQFLGEDADIEKHFTPSYRPWQQRLAYVPDGDLFKAIASGQASVVTDGIERFVEQGIQLQSGSILEADIIITATGFNVLPLGGMQFSVDGKAIDLHNHVTYRGILFSDIPNMSQMFGYFRTSWTMRVDLVADFICNLLKHMDSLGTGSVTPVLTPEEQAMERLPWVEEEVFNSGYIKRSMHLFAHQLAQAPWKFNYDYYTERDELPAVDLDETALVYAPRTLSSSRSGT